MNSQQETRKTSKTFRIFLTAALLAGLMLGLAPAGPVHAATFVVDTTTDSNAAAYQACTAAANDCSLRGAITKANALAGADIITLPAGTYLLTIAGASEDANASGDLDLTSDITINGAGADSTIIDAGQLDRVLHVFSGSTVELNGLTLTNGKAPNSYNNLHCWGGGVYTNGTLTIRDSIIRDSTTGLDSNIQGGFGGGVFNTGMLTIDNSTIRDNTTRDGTTGPGGKGGGVYNEGTLTIQDSAIRDNTTGDSTDSSGGHGGGVYNVGTLTIQESAISRNATGNSSTNDNWDGKGGGVYTNGGTAIIQNTTISGNTANGQGGGITNYHTSDSVTLAHCTITGNTADADNDLSATSGGGLWWRVGGGFIVENTIIAGNTDMGTSTTTKHDCSGTIDYISQGYNLVGAGTGCPSGGTGDQTTSDPKLAALTDNGGPTETHALLYDSPAVEVIPSGTNGCGGAYTTDQRGAIRPGGGLCDVGAYESPYIFWDGGGADNNTSTAANWSGDITPAETDIPVFYNTGQQATVDADLTVAGWVIDTSPSDDIYLGFSEPYPVLTVNGDWLQLNGYINGGNSLIDIAGAFDLSGGQFVAPQSPGLLTIGGGFHHTGGTFNSYSGSVVLDNTADQTLVTATSFHDLYLNDGLLGYWKMDEGTGTTVTDSSGYGYDGAANGDPAWDTNTPGTIDFYDPYALHLDHSPADYVNIPNTTNIDNLQQLTLSAWVRLDTMPTGSRMRFITLGNEKAVLRYDGSSDTGQLHFYIRDGGGSFHNIRVNDILSAGTWLHVAGTYDGATMRLYLNGTEQDTEVTSVTMFAGDGVLLSHSGSAALDGLLDDVRVYNRALSAAEIGDLAAGNHPETSLATTSLGAPLDVNGDLTLNSGTLAQPQTAGYWKLDDGAGTTAADSSANGYDGTFGNSPTWSSDVPSTHFANANSLSFDRADADYVNIPGTTNIDSLPQLSLSTWVNLASTPSTASTYTYMRFISLGNEKAVLRYYDYDGTQRLQFYMSIGESLRSIVVDYAWATGTWYHVAGTYDGSTMRLYLDGVEQGTYSISGTAVAGNGAVLSWSSSAAALDGLLDDVRVYNRALSATEVQALADGYDVRGQDITVAGDLVRNGGVFEPGEGTVTFDGTGDQNLDTDAIAFYDLTVSSSSTLVDLADFTVDGALTNNGSLRQTNDTPNGSTTQFLRILNAAGDTTKYYGVDITPAGDMGATTVTIGGNQNCTTDDTSKPVRRCFEISPTTDQPAEVTFWYLESERNENTAANVNVFHWESNAWVQEGGAYTRSDDGTHYSVAVTGVDNYSPFILDDVSPTVVTLRNFAARPAGGRNGVVLALLVLGMVGVLWARRRRPGRERSV